MKVGECWKALSSQWHWIPLSVVDLDIFWGTKQANYLSPNYCSVWPDGPGLPSPKSRRCVREQQDRIYNDR